MPMWNGPIECRLFRFDLVAGSAPAVSRRPRPRATVRRSHDHDVDRTTSEGPGTRLICALLLATAADLIAEQAGA